MQNVPNVPLMAAGAPPPAEDRDDGDDAEYNKVASDLIFEASLAFLRTPEGTQNLLKTIQGAKDVGTAIGKVAALVVGRVTSELDNADLSVGEEPVFGEEGGLTKVLVAIYVVANEEGANLVMEETLLQAYEVAEADLEKMFAAGGMPNAPVS